MPDATDGLARDLLDHSAERLTHYLGQIERCAGLLTTEQLWNRPNAHVNSVANLILHLTGNVRQWILGGVGGEMVERDRPAEFAARDGRPASEVVPPLRDAVERAIATMRGLDALRLAEPRTIQGYPVRVGVAVLHVVEHFAYHAGQIVHATKWLADVDLSLYDAQGRRLDGSATP
jgi:uncharacterized damage-inducible protein DinB